MQTRFLRHVLFLFLAFLASFAGAQQQPPRDYPIGAGDLLNVRVFQNADLSGEFRVSETGTLVLPLIGELKVAGMTTTDVGNLVTRRLREGDLIKQPSVTVGVAQYRSIQVSVLGNVTRPGKYPLEQSVNRITEVIALAGGVTPAGGEIVWLIRQDGGKQTRIEIDVPTMLTGADQKADLLVRNGDTLFVPRAPVFYIYGAAQRTGQYRVERGMNVMQALAMGGGPTARGTDRGIRLSRRDADGKLTTRDANPNEQVLPDDVFIVPERLF